MLDPEFYWEKGGTYSRIDLPCLEDPVAPLWIDKHSTYNGVNDEIPLDLMGSVSDSLRLIHVGQLKLKVFSPGKVFGNPKRRVQGRFSHAGNCYALWVTDPGYERKYLAEPDGSYEIGECYLTVSLGEPYNNACYKLIAAIIECS